MIKFLSPLKRNTKGNVAIVSAIALPTVLMIGFGAVDYGFAVQAKQELKSAAGAAALTAVNEAYIAYTNGEEVDLDEIVNDKARDVFTSKVTELTKAELISLQITPKLINNIFSVEVAYSAKVKSQIGQLTGYDHFSLSGSQSAFASATSYINVNLVFDVSGSMGIGATVEDQKIVFDTTGCAFACHTNASRGNSSYDRARTAGADMRIDVARDAAILAVETVEQIAETDDQVSFSLFKFSNITTEILPIGDTRGGNLSQVKQLIEDEVQMDIYFTGTNTELAIMDVAAKLPASGSGKTPDDRIQYIIVLTDGIENSQAWNTGKGWFPHEDKIVNSPYMQHAYHEINYAPGTTPCAALRENGTQIYFINTEYIVPSYGNLSAHNIQRFDFIEDTLHDLVPERFAECAGDAANVIPANSPSDIKAAFTNLVSEFSSPLKLLN